MQQTPYPEKIRKKIQHVIEILKHCKLTVIHTRILGNLEMLEIDSNNPYNMWLVYDTYELSKMKK